MSNKTVGQKTADAIAELAQVRAAARELEARDKELRDSILADMGDHKVAIFRNQIIARKSEVTRTTVDTKRLAENHPQAYADTKRETTSMRLTLA